jgi:hypothetical protein
MTRLYIDQQEVAPVPVGVASLGQVLKHVEDNHLSSRTVIREIRIDGSPVLSDENSSPSLADISGQEKIEIFTGPLTQVAQESVQEAATYLERLLNAMPSMISRLRQGPAPEAFQDLKQLYEGFYWMNLLLDRLTQSFGIDLDSIPLQATNARGHHLGLISALQGVVDAQEKKDFGLVADILEYEVLPMIPACRDLFVAIRGRIAAEA